MKSLRSEIAAIALVSIAVISTLIIWISLVVYESLYEDFVSKELQAMSSNLANDLLPYVTDPADSFTIINILLRLDEYENVEYARVYNEQGAVLNAYVGKAFLTHNNDSDKHKEQLTETEISTLAPGIEIKAGHVRVARIIGEPTLPQGKLVISYRMESELANSQRMFITAVVPFVVTVALLALFVALELQNRSLMPLFRLIDKMRRVEETKDYAIDVRVEGKREIKALTSGFSRMMSEIAKQTDQINQKNRLLTRQQEQMEKLANFDTLTGLPNRQFLMKSLAIEIARAKRNQEDVALLFLDLDGFKIVNDSFGHDVGDRLLCQIADVINENLRDGDVVGRIGGDEFVIILSGNPAEPELEDVAQRLVNALSIPQVVEQWKLDAGVSIGIAMAKDCDYNITTLMSNADIAMYHSKRNGRGQFTLFTRMMQDDNQRMIRIASNIAAAVENNEFYLVYQPKVNRHGVVESVEALIRWYNPHLGMVSPAEFIPIAEQSDKVSIITKWVIGEVCKDIPTIIDIHGPNTTVSMNLSASDLKDVAVTAYVLEKIHNLGKLAEAVEFEITESAYLKSFHAGNIFFEKIRRAGCQISLDDFGTGYSSLSYLTEFNIDTLKIDRQFVSQIGVSERSELITVTIIEMARHLKLKVCAEGVETKEQAAFLVTHGCHLLQGYYFGKPEPLSTHKPSIQLASPE